jgi:beta-N-acetylhexosaminidase
MSDLRAAPYHLDDATVARVDAIVAGMTDAQLVGQLLCLYLRTPDVVDWIGWLAERGIEPGGLMMTSRPPADARRDIALLQDASPVPLLFAGNLESGAVNFLAATEAFANPMQLAATRDPATAELLAEHCARLADDVGINWAFAPVVDVATNPANPITNTRAFSDDPALVSAFAERYIHHLETRGIATSPKHFPGDGADDRDQHLVTSSNDLGAEEWWATAGTVYRRIIAAGARTIMVGHIRQPALTRERVPGIADRDIMPGTLAPELLRGVLREELGFAGLVVSDNSAMTGLTSLLPRHEALPRMLEAGVDMILGNLDVEEDFRILVDAVRTGRLGRDRLEESARRVLGTKASMGLLDRVDRRGRSVPDPVEEAGWRRDVAERSVTLVKDTQQLLPLAPERQRRVLVYVVGDAPTFYDPTPPLAPGFVAALRERGMEVEVREIPGNTTTVAEAEHLHERFDICIYFSAVRFVGNSNVLRMTWSPWQGFDAPRHVASLPTVLVSVADPYLLQDVPMIRTAINGYTPTTATVDAIVGVLFGDIPPRGESPVDPFAGRWDAAL